MSQTADKNKGQKKTYSLALTTQAIGKNEHNNTPRNVKSAVYATPVN